MHINELSNFVKLVNRHKPVNIITQKKKEDKYNLLYNYLLNENPTQADILLKLYPNENKREQFRSLKSRFLNKLILEFLTIENPFLNSNSDFQKVTYLIYSKWSISNILIENGYRDISISIAEQTIKKCLQYHLLPLTLNLIQEIKLHYGVLRYNKNKYIYYNKLSEKVLEENMLLFECQDLYIQLGQKVTLTKNYTTKDIGGLETKINEIIKKLDSIDSYFIKFYGYNAFYFLQLIKSNTSEQLKICDIAIDYFKPLKKFKNVALFSFTQKKGVSLLGVKEYSKAIHCFQNCLKLIPKPNIQGTQFLYSYKLTAYILQKKYNKAFNVLKMVLSDAEFKNLSPNFKEPWHLKEAFIHFLIKTKKIDPSLAREYKLRPFRLSRFLNDVSTFSKDKKGLNITINIIQFLFLLIDGKHDQMLDKLNSLKQYNYKYLRKKEYARPSNFIKMLLKIPDGKYKAQLIRKKANKYYQKLLDNPMDYSEHAISIEIIPYEVLWDEILGTFE